MNHVLQVHPVGETGQPDPRVSERLGQPDQDRLRMRLQHRLRVPARPTFASTCTVRHLDPTRGPATRGAGSSSTGTCVPRNSPKRHCLSRACRSDGAASYRQIPSATTPNDAPGTGEGVPGTRKRLEISQYIRRRCPPYRPPAAPPPRCRRSRLRSRREVGLPGALVPDLHPRARADDHEGRGRARPYSRRWGREVTRPLLSEPAVVRAGEEAGCRPGPPCVSSAAREGLFRDPLELGCRNIETAILPLVTTTPPPLMPRFGRKDQPALFV